MSITEVPGQLAPEDVTRRLKTEVSQLLERGIRSFPGSQPVSFARKHIDVLYHEDYYVCEKSDGMRCLMYLTTENGVEQVYLITRTDEYYWVPDLHFPRRGGDLSSFHRSGLLDGELILSRKKGADDNEKELKYLIFDCLSLDGKLLVKKSFDKRLGYLRSELYEPYCDLWRAYPEDCKTMFPFKVAFKEMEFSYGLPKIFGLILPNLGHVSDGLIFTSRNSAYVYGTDQKLLKWKPKEENTVDFLLELVFQMYSDEDEVYTDYDSVPKECNLLVWEGRDEHRPYAKLHLEPMEWEALKSREEPLNYRVIECYQDDEGRWRYHRFRGDKETANHISTVEKVIESIQDSVSKEELLEASPKIREKWKQREAARQQRLK